MTVIYMIVHSVLDCQATQLWWVRWPHTVNGKMRWREATRPPMPWLRKWSR